MHFCTRLSLVTVFTASLFIVSGEAKANFNVHVKSTNPVVGAKAFDLNLATLTPQEKKLVDKYNSVIDDHLNYNFSITRTVRILVNHYPQHVNQILIAAYQHYPTRIPVINRAVIQVEPALTSDVLTTTHLVAPQAFDETIAQAIDVEPSYIDDIVTTATRLAPEKLNTIVRVAIVSEPRMSETVVKSAAESSPDNFLDAVVSSIKEIPQITKHAFVAVKDFFNFNNAEQKTRPKPEQWNRFIVEAKAQGINREELEWFKEHGYLTVQQVAKVYSNKADK